jgi:hypothetical protein
MIALVEHENLGFVLQAAKGGGMDHPVAIAPERAAGSARRLVEQPSAAAVGVVTWSRLIKRRDTTRSWVQRARDLTRAMRG